MQLTTAAIFLCNSYILTPLAEPLMGAWSKMADFNEGSKSQVSVSLEPAPGHPLLHAPWLTRGQMKRTAVYSV